MRVMIASQAAVYKMRSLPENGFFVSLCKFDTDIRAANVA